MTVNGTDFGSANQAMQQKCAPKQTLNVMGDGTVRARNAGTTDKYRTYKFQRIPSGQKDSFLNVHGEGALATVSVVDDEAVAFTGRVWNKSVAVDRRAGGFYSATITYRIES